MVEPDINNSDIHIPFVVTTSAFAIAEVLALETFLKDFLFKMETMRLEKPVLTMQGPATKELCSKDKKLMLSKCTVFLREQTSCFWHND